MRCASVLFLLGLAGSPALAEPAPRLRLEGAIAKALAHNPSFAQVRADGAAAEAQVLAAQGADDWIMGGHASEQSNRGSAADAGTTPLDELLFSTDLTRPLPTGGRATVRLAADYSRQAATGATMPSPAPGSGALDLITPSLVLELAHPLAKGAGLLVARAARWRAQAQRQVAALLLYAAALDLARDVAAAYWELVYAKGEAAIRQDSLTRAREQLRIVEANIEVGKQPPSASAEVEVAIALRQEEVLLAELAVKERQLELGRLLGSPSGSVDGEPADSFDPEVNSPILRLLPAQALARALAQNPALAATRAQAGALQIDRAVARNGLLPQVDIGVAGGLLGQASGLGAAFGRLAQADGYTASATVTVSAPIGNRSARGALSVATQGLRKAELGQEAEQARLTVAIGQAVAQLEIARQRMAVLASSTGRAALDLAAERARFAVGRATNFDVLRRQDEVAQAAQRQLRAKADTALASSRLSALTGDLVAPKDAR